jgi:hypothetical protein
VEGAVLLALCGELAGLHLDDLAHVVLSSDIGSDNVHYHKLLYAFFNRCQALACTRYRYVVHCPRQEAPMPTTDERPRPLGLRPGRETEEQLQRIAELRTGGNQTEVLRLAVALAEPILTDTSTLRIPPQAARAAEILAAYIEAHQEGAENVYQPNFALITVPG